MSSLVDLTGKTFKLWTVLGRGRTDQTRSGSRVFWLCRCQCGTEKEILGHYLRSGESGSCGCQRWKGDGEVTSKQVREYRIWCSMKTRCRRDPRYVAKGITVCDRWRKFAAFYEDMGECPTPQHSIDRIDNDLGYSPENCRWASPAEQARNQSRNRLLTFRGETKPLCDWAVAVGISPKTVEMRLNGYGWTVEDALTRPVRRWGR